MYGSTSTIFSAYENQIENEEINEITQNKKTKITEEKK
jgi:hypothetical protein